MTLLKFNKTLCFLALFSFTNIVSAVDIIRFVNSKEYPDPKQSYFVDLLTLSLEASKEKYGPYQLKPLSINMAQGRTSLMLQQSQLIDLTWRMTSTELEDTLQAVYFPILKGMMGYRIFIIQNNKQQMFPKELTLENLKKIPLGQGINWADTDILKANGFRVTSGNDISLLDMLKKGRFTFFPRGIHEPWLEITNEPSLSVEKNFMLKYPAPVFFFVNKHNIYLQQRLTYGLTQLLESGQFEAFFLNHPITANIMTKANVTNRRVFTLKNPLLSEQVKTLLKNKALWIKTK
jgi:hypothetical protein